MKRSTVLGPVATRLRNQVADNIGSRPDCMIAADMGAAMLVFVRRKYSVTTVVNSEGFQPYTAQADIEIPVPLLLRFDNHGGVDQRMLARFQGLGGKSVVVRKLEEAVAALVGTQR